MTAAEIMMGAAELNRRAILEQAAASMPGVQADLLLPREDWVDPRTAQIVQAGLAGATLGFALRG